MIFVVLLGLMFAVAFYMQRAADQKKAADQAAFFLRGEAAKEWINSIEELPTVETTGIMLQKGERCYYAGEASWSELRSVTKRVSYSGPVASIKIAKGLRYRVGSASVTAHRQNEVQTIDSGILYITSKRLFFDGALKNTSIAYKAVSSIKLFDGGFEVEKQTGKSPLLGLSTEPERAAVIAIRAQMEWAADD